MSEEIKLERDSCQKCNALKGQLNGIGQQIYCSEAHAHELSNLRRSKATEVLKKEIFDTVYRWGRNNIVVDDAAPTYRELVDRLEETWY